MILRQTAILRHYEVGIKGADRTSVISAASAGKAKYEYWLTVSEVWGLYRNEAKDLWKRITCRSVTGPSQSAARRLAYTAEHRGLPFVRIGMRVECDGHTWHIVQQWQLRCHV